jgi:hypothetical protein
MILRSWPGGLVRGRAGRGNICQPLKMSKMEKEYIPMMLFGFSCWVVSLRWVFSGGMWYGKKSGER